MLAVARELDHLADFVRCAGEGEAHVQRALLDAPDRAVEAAIDEDVSRKTEERSAQQQMARGGKDEATGLRAMAEVKKLDGEIAVLAQQRGEIEVANANRQRVVNLEKKSDYREPKKPDFAKQFESESSKSSEEGK